MQPFFNLIYFMLLPRAHFILYTLQGTGGLVLGLVMEYLVKSEKAIVYRLQQMDFSCNTHLRIPRFCMLGIVQSSPGSRCVVPLVRMLFPQQFPLLGSAFNNLSPRLHFGLAHFTVAQIFGFGGRTGTHTNTGGQRGRRQVVFR